MILSKELRKELVKKIDSLIKLPVWAEPFDGLLLNAGFKYLDENYSDRVPQKFKDNIVEAVECFVAEDWENLAMVIPEVISEIVDIPGLDEDLEGKFLAINMKAAFEFIQWLAEKNK